ncbi:MAG: lipopolysaccharide transport periplasmic protein LptA [Sideroxydans sp.]|nr:lipopolysaccharide transport periplasmic protein LptA [Sideroxydans sp.]
MKLQSVSRSLLLGAVLFAHAATGFAERADHNKPVHLESDQVSIDDANQISVFTGNVVLTQGTLIIRGDKIVVTQDKSGFKHGTATGNLASFRQKREGLNEYVEGYGDRIEYDTRSEIMEIFGQARVKRGQDDVRGEHITYNSKTEIFQVNSAPGKQAPAPGKEQRVRAVIQPKDKQAPAIAPADEPLSIKPDTTLIRPEGNP